MPTLKIRSRVAQNAMPWAFVFGFALLMLMGATHAQTPPAPYSSCWPGDSDCPVCPNATENENFNSIIYLSTHPTLVANAAKAQEVIKSYPGVIALQPLYELHTSLEYSCCYSTDQMDTIVNSLHKWQWTSFNLTYNVFGCNVDHEGFVWVHAKPSEDGQMLLFNFIHSMEQYIQSLGIPVTHPRIQPFHMTLGQVNVTYPTDTLVDRLNGTDFGTITFDWFELNGNLYYSS